jgi:predicted secreted protein
VRFTPATAHTATGAPTFEGTLPSLFGLPVLRSVKEAGDFEAVLSFGVGLWDKVPFHAFTLTGPSRLVIDFTVPSGGPGRLDEVDNGRLVYLRVSQQVVVALKTCVSCGYSWQLATAPNAGVMRIVTKSVVALPHPAGAVGFPYESRWVLRAAGTGQTSMLLREMGPGRGRAAVARYSLRFTVT